MRKTLLFALCFTISSKFAFSQLPNPVPALPDSKLLTSVMLVQFDKARLQLRYYPVYTPNSELKKFLDEAKQSIKTNKSVRNPVKPRRFKDFDFNKLVRGIVRDSKIPSRIQGIKKDKWEAAKNLGLQAKVKKESIETIAVLSLIQKRSGYAAVSVSSQGRIAFILFKQTDIKKGEIQGGKGPKNWPPRIKTGEIFGGKGPKNWPPRVKTGEIFGGKTPKSWPPK